MKPKPTLIFIPDISGFTKFMSEADPNFSNQVIPALLNKLIYSNTLGLKVSEIEGDAVFFFKNDGIPELKELIEQCKLFYIEFYKKIDELMSKNDSEESNDLHKKLGLKIILHFGDDVNAVQIGNRIKLMGEDVITAHKLLKNDVQLNEYLLISEALIKQFKDLELENLITWAPLSKGQSEYQHIGKIAYRYSNLEPLLKNNHI